MKPGSPSSSAPTVASAYLGYLIALEVLFHAPTASPRGRPPAGAGPKLTLRTPSARWTVSRRQGGTSGVLQLGDQGVHLVECLRAVSPSVHAVCALACARVDMREAHSVDS